MIQVSLYRDRVVCILGLGQTGVAAVRALEAGGSQVWAWDDDAAVRKKAAGMGIPLVNLETCDWTRPAALLLSPGISHLDPSPHPMAHLAQLYPDLARFDLSPHPVARLARLAGCPIIGDTEQLYLSQTAATYVGITGTNGKSTVTALVGHILRQAGRTAQMGGNLGVSALELEPLGDGGVYVLEMSSYQLELIGRTTFDISVLLNIAPDHLERHGGMEHYISAKLSILAHQGRACTAIIGVDDLYCRTIFEKAPANLDSALIPISGSQALDRGVFALNGILHDGPGSPIMDMAEAPTLPGVHNHQNAAAAFAITRVLGVAPEDITAGICSYPGLPHRQQRVAFVDGVLFINDSKATNSEAAAKALDSYGAIFWIAGGRPKEGGLAGIENHLGSVRHAYMIGEAAEDFARILKGSIPVTRAGTLEVAVNKAFNAARKIGSATVLFSPACASFDQFDDFQARGEAFCEIVKRLS